LAHVVELISHSTLLNISCSQWKWGNNLHTIFLKIIWNYFNIFLQKVLVLHVFFIIWTICNLNAKISLLWMCAVWFVVQTCYLCKQLWKVEKMAICWSSTTHLLEWHHHLGEMTTCWKYIIRLYWSQCGKQFAMYWEQCLISWANFSTLATQKKPKTGVFCGKCLVKNYTYSSRKKGAKFEFWRNLATFRLPAKGCCNVAIRV
jgi:hypothetical protein